jgi:hypothetical protein
MSTIPWASIKNLAIFVAPVVIPKAYGYYQSWRHGPPTPVLAIQPIPPRVRWVLALLATCCLAFLAQTLPALAPENIFARVPGGVHLSLDSLFQRIAKLRPGGILLPSDELLRGKIVSRESRQLYLKYGPDVVAECPFCTVENPTDYLYYAVPSILIPHVANLVAIAIATSPSLSGKYGNRWRASATVVAFLICVVELYYVVTFNHVTNAANKRSEITFFFWTERLCRLIALATLDGALAWVIFLSSTNRAFVQMPSSAERVETVYRSLASVKSKLNAVTIVKNTSARDADLRARSQDYWSQEVRLMDDVMEDKEVLEGVNDALSNRIDIDAITKDAASYAETISQTL